MNSIRNISAFGRVALSAITSLFLISCATVSGPTIAAPSTDIPVLVMGEDSDRRSVKRSSDIFRRVITEIQSQMSAYNFDVKDEHAIAARLDWEFRDRRPKSELFQVAQLANQSGNASVYTRALVTFKIVAAAKNLGFATKAQVRIAGEVYDVESDRFLGSFEAPRMTFPAPRNCTGICISEVVGDHARDLAAAVGDVIRKKLAYMARGSAASTVGNNNNLGSGTGLENTYTFVFRNFKASETYEITSVMEREFPEYVRTLPPSGSGPVLKYGYVTRAPQHKVHRWINMLLADMGIDPDSEVSLTMRGTTITVEKLVTGSVYHAPPRKRFQ